MFENATILITGGTGSWGQELTRYLLNKRPKEVRIFSRNEYRQVMMRREFEGIPQLTFLIGDVRDYEAVYEACRDVDYVFHLAALKHVPVCEIQPSEALKTNVQGTENVIRASIERKVRKVIDVSTDKAVDPINFYGMTKAIGEKLMIHANSISPDTRFVCIRGGNVLGTNGSVVPLFKEQILEGKDVTITSFKMTRFFLTVTEAIELLIQAATEAIGGETFVMRMPSCRIIDLVLVLGKSLGKPVRMKEVGIRIGEKLHEVLISSSEAASTYHYNKKYDVILPPHTSTLHHQKYKTLSKVSYSHFSSDQQLMKEEELVALLKKGNFIYR